MRSINIAICINSSEDSRMLGVDLLSNIFDVKVHICKTLEELIACCANIEIDSFVFEYKSKVFNAKDMSMKLGSSANFKNSSFFFVCEKDDMTEALRDSGLRVDLYMNRPFVKNEFEERINEIWKKQFKRILPENLRVLILDDNPKVVEVIEMHMDLIQHKNYESCNTIEEAKKKIATKDFDLLLLDWDLHDGTCMEIIDVARSTTSSKRLKDSLTIVITGRDAVEDIMTLVDKNVKDHIIKPFDHNEFAEKISYALERHNKRLV